MPPQFGKNTLYRVEVSSSNKFYKTKKSLFKKLYFVFFWKQKAGMIISLTQMLSNFEDQTWFSAHNFKGIQDGGQGIVKLDINNSTDDSDNATYSFGCSRGCSFCTIRLTWKIKIKGVITLLNGWGFKYTQKMVLKSVGETNKKITNIKRGKY